MKYRGGGTRSPLPSAADILISMMIYNIVATDTAEDGCYFLSVLTVTSKQFV